MKKALLAVAAMTCMGTAALAGPNEGGTLIAALSEGTVYTTDIEDYCGSVTTSTCEGAVTTAPAAGETGVVLNILSALPAGGRMMAIAFGWDYPADLSVAAAAPCGDIVIELPSAGWPGPGTGTAMTWSTVKTGLVEVYWAGVYSYGPGTLTLQGHPTQGGVMADDAIPANEDPIAGFGTFGFGVPGSVACPVDTPDPTGACCVGPDCSIQTAADCEAAGGIYQGDDTVCNPNPCIEPPETGACCFGEDCVVATEADCARDGGVYQGDGSVCQPNPCIPPVPTIETSWGAVKSNYR